MSNIVPASGLQRPSWLPAPPKKANSELSGGVQSGFPIISIRGKVWRVRKGGEEVNYTDEDGDAVQSLEVVLVKSAPRPSKLFYASKYVEGSTEPPTCWSADGLKPDAEVPEPVHNSCASCPNNIWGSRVSEEGKKGRACADSRRVAVVFAHDLEEKGEDATLFLLRIPPASLNPLKEYGEKVLDPKGIPYYAVVTKLGFDAQASSPKITFKAKTLLTEEQYNAVQVLRTKDEASRILSESLEHAEAVGTTEDGEAATGRAAATASTPAQKPASTPAASAPKPKKAQPVEEEIEADEEEPAPAPKPKPKPTPPPPPPPAEEDEEEEAQPPPPKPKKTKAAPAAEGEAGAAAPASKTDFDSMLDSILGQ